MVYLTMVNFSNPNKSDKESQFIKNTRKNICLWRAHNFSCTKFNKHWHFLSCFVHVVFPSAKTKWKSTWISKTVNLPNSNNQKQSVCIHLIYYCSWYLDFIDEDVGHPKEFRLGRSEDCIGSEGVNRTKIGVITRLRRPWCCGLVKWWHRASKELKLQYVIGIDFQVIYQL